LILVITGTHEQPFDRLVSAADTLEGDVIIQYGYGSPPERKIGYDMLPQERLRELATAAKVVITHGGPGAIFEAFAVDKIPIAVPRLKRYGEHVDDHQLAFVRHMESKRRVIGVYDPIADLQTTVESHHLLIRDCALPSFKARENRLKLAEHLNHWLKEQF
jgi:UDP-N-acetylglucosamine transferase subunit ALG13